MSEITGLVTFLFTDIEGSTRLWEERTDAMRAALPCHDACLRKAIEGVGGQVFKTVGDAFCAAFATPAAALQAALEGQRALRHDPLTNGTDGGIDMRVRMGIHAGDAVQRDNDFFGPPVNRAARIESAAHGGQILLSAYVRDLLSADLPGSVTLVDLGAHRLKDLAEPVMLWQVAHPDLPLEFPPLRSLSAHPNNLPGQVTAFIGREEELHALKLLFRKNARLITLTGPGGIGKTRIALQAAADQIERFPGGTWWVDLSPLREAAHVLPAIGAALGLKEEPNVTPAKQLTEKLREQPTLLALDNFEQVAEAAEEMDTLLRACPSLTLLVTSRAALNLSSEHEFPLSELSLPEAVSLFSLRLQQARPSFILDENTRPLVENLCRRLESIPLALELAAAQAKMLTLPQIEKQLGQRFRLLVSPYKDVAQRQRTLRAAVDWSYDLLSDAERRLFTRLSIFADTFTLEAAEAVCPDDEEVYFGVIRLREQSLLRAEWDAEPPRFRMLESLREYGQEKLQASGEYSEVMAHYARYHADLAQRFYLASGEEESQTYSLLSIAVDDVRTSLEWLLQNGDFDAAGAMSVALTGFWERRGSFRDGKSFLQRCLDRVSDRTLNAQLFDKAGWMSYRVAAYDEAETLLQRSLALSAETGDHTTEAQALNALAWTAQALGQPAEAYSLFGQALKAAENAGNEARQADIQSNLGFLASAEGRVTEAREWLEAALTLYEHRQDIQGKAACLCNLSDLALRSQNWTEAQDFAEQCLPLFRKIEDQTGIATTLTNMAEAASHSADHETVERYVREALNICATTDLRSLMPHLLLAWTRSLVERGAMQAGARVFAAAERMLAAVGTDVAWEAGAEEISILISVIGTEILEVERSRFYGLTSEEVVHSLMQSIKS